MDRATWWLNRLRRMSFSEVSHRALRIAQQRVERLQAGRFQPPAPKIRPGANLLVTPQLSRDQLGRYVQSADRVLAGNWQLLWRPVEVAQPVCWQRNPVSHHEIPQVFGKALNYRNTEVVGDIKYYWVFNRQHELLALVQAWALTEQDKYLQGARVLLSSWLEANPYPLGANWTSSLESAIRVLNWSAAWSLLGGADSPLFQDSAGADLLRRWLDSIYSHLYFIQSHYSRHSSANNHLIGELSGVIVGAKTWPYWATVQRWSVAAECELEREVQLQIAPDGVSLEQSVFYEHVVLEFLFFAGLARQRVGEDFSPLFWERAYAMVRHLNDIADVAGNRPSFGDADDAIMLPLEPQRGVNPYDQLATLAAAQRQRVDLLPRHVSDARSCWVAGLPSEESVTVEQRASVRFPNGGYRVLGRDFGTAEEVRLVMDVGSLGYLSIAAHGHADALSLWLSIAGEPMLIDPGTYSYQSHRQWRDYFRSTTAHNTVTIDGLSQADMGGPFMWMNAFDGQVTAETLCSVTATHDGYQRLPDPVAHEREVRFVAEQNVFFVTDRLRCSGQHRVERHWHLAPQSQVSLTEGVLRASRGGAELQIVSDSGVAELLSGQESPICGWTSDRFDHKVPSPTLRVSQDICGDVELTTEIHFEMTREVQ